jgi:hypothetical protein
MYSHVLDRQGNVVGLALVPNVTPSIHPERTGDEHEAARLQRLAWTSGLRARALLTGGSEGDALRWQREAATDAARAREACACL